ncbi:MAG: type II secretion system minor pseudopilin GspK [Burkholderiales bacterium]|nr:type II secretion system minor pseudopilin GspK [Burkholderiales bacterium]
MITWPANSYAPARRAERGAALVVAMLLTALGAAVAVQMIVPLSGWLVREYRARDTQASYTLADAAASWATTVLAADVRLGPVDHYGELWATPLPQTPVEGGTIEGRITDLQARFNLNSVAPRGVKSAANIALAKTLFTSANLPTTLVDSLADAIDRDDVTDDGQSERQRYGQALRNAPLRDLGDLLDVPGFSVEYLRTLAALIVVLPEATAINVNTATSATLAAAFPGAQRELLAAAIARRDRQAFTGAGEFAAALQQPVVDGVLSVNTQFFAVDAVIRFERAAHRVQLRIARPPNGRAQVISRLISHA